MDRLLENWPMNVFFLQMIWIIQMGQPVAKRTVWQYETFYLQIVWTICLCCADAKQNGVVWQLFANNLDHPNGPVCCKKDGRERNTHRIWPARADEPLRASITTCLLQIPNMTNHGLAAANSSDTVDTYHAVWSSNWHRRHSLSLGSLKVSLESLVFQLTKWAEESFTRDINRLSGVVRLQ